MDAVETVISLASSCVAHDSVSWLKVGVSKHEHVSMFACTGQLT
jgi:hypothetical protein